MLKIYSFARLENFILIIEKNTYLNNLLSFYQSQGYIIG